MYSWGWGQRVDANWLGNTGSDGFLEVLFLDSEVQQLELSAKGERRKKCFSLDHYGRHWWTNSKFQSSFFFSCDTKVDCSENREDGWNHFTLKGGALFPRWQDPTLGVVRSLNGLYEMQEEVLVWVATRGKNNFLECPRIKFRRWGKDKTLRRWEWAIKPSYHQRERKVVIEGTETELSQSSKEWCVLTCTPLVTRFPGDYSCNWNSVKAVDT